MIHRVRACMHPKMRGESPDSGIPTLVRAIAARLSDLQAVHAQPVQPCSESDCSGLGICPLPEPFSGARALPVDPWTRGAYSPALSSLYTEPSDAAWSNCCRLRICLIPSAYLLSPLHAMYIWGSLRPYPWQFAEDYTQPLPSNHAGSFLARTRSPDFPGSTFAPARLQRFRSLRSGML
jgi:hypothetical protein